VVTEDLAAVWGKNRWVRKEEREREVGRGRLTSLLDLLLGSVVTEALETENGVVVLVLLVTRMRDEEDQRVSTRIKGNNSDIPSTS
jgi:hypothetical protein